MNEEGVNKMTRALDRLDILVEGLKIIWFNLEVTLILLAVYLGGAWLFLLPLAGGNLLLILGYFIWRHFTIKWLDEAGYSE